MQDLSNGYDYETESFIAVRSPTIGVSVVRSWAQTLPPAVRVLEIGCGDGIPITQTLIEEGLKVYAVDSSPKMVSAFRRNFPETPVLCKAAEQLDEFDRQFDVAIAWGLLFLLAPEKQKIVVHNISNALNSGGRFLFTSPKEFVTWTDVITQRKSESLGAFAYQSIFQSAGLTLIAEYDDEGANHYYDAKKE
jgi:2-polyprenyl-3-methyl-5-hydroxy-6-metoxy-1,4-benzoquinol methylase